jgi:gamma-glutamyltranspeptidase/glutathione hydrolase
MVVSAQHYATKAGQAILDEGGNAIDAAVAMGYALAVVHPCCGNIGGGGFMMIRFADGRSTFINFREKAPAGINAKMFATKGSSTWLSGGHLKGSAEKPYLSIGVPGTVKGLNTALKEYGTLPLAQVMRPAIELAEQGYVLEKQDIDILNAAEPELRHDPDVVKAFLEKHKTFKKGERLVQKDLAQSLRKIATKGTKEFYSGSLTSMVVKDIQAQGGVLTLKDFSNYSIEIMKPIVCQYRGYEIITSPPPSSGGVTICESLNILEHIPASKLGYHSAENVHYFVEALRYSYADRNQHLGDPNFVHNPTQELISKKYGAEIFQKIKKDKEGDSSKIGFPSSHREAESTTAYVVVDKEGNAVSVTYTLNGYFGSKEMGGRTGFFLNNEMADFTLKVGEPNSFGLVQGDKNLIAPNKRPLSSMSPTIITKNGQLFMVIGTPGGSTIPSQLIGVIQNVIDFGLDIQMAVNAPRIHMQWLPDKVYLEPDAISKDTEEALKKMGYDLVAGSPYNTPRWGAVMAIEVDRKTRQLKGAVDNRRPAGLAVGR